MTSEPVNREQQVSEVLLGYLDAVQAGLAPDREQLLTAHPDLRAELTEFFAGYDEMDQLAAPLREAVSPSGSHSPAMTRRPNGPLTQSTAVPPLDVANLGQLGDFQLLRELGRGGMGVVYEAEQISLRRRVALKVLPFAAAIDPRQLQRFRNEAQAAAQLHHPSIVPVHAVGVERGVHYYAMQYIEGQSLATLIAELRRSARDQGPEATRPFLVPAGPTAASASTLQAAADLTQERGQGRRFYHRVAKLGQQAALALEHAHQLGVVHRDIKPANLLLDLHGQLWITDFGLAQVQRSTELTATGELLGTLRYASPEQIMAQRGLVDHRSDIYSLGATLYELLTLQPLFDGKEHHVLLRQIAEVEPVPPRSRDRQIPVELETIVLKATAKSPAERYATAQELAEDLRRFLEDQPVLARRPTLWQRASKWSRRHRGLVTAAVVFGVLALIGLTASNVWIARERAETQAAYDRERDQRARAEESFHQARRAVDYLTQISEEELARMPQLQSLRRRMLENALVYYQNFIDQRHDDPTIQAELTASRARVTRILGELSALDGYWQLLLLISPSVQADLKVSDEQKEEIAQLGRDIGEQTRNFFRDFGKQSSEARQKQFLELAQAHERDAARILTAEQTRRLQQIALQLQQRGPHGFRDPQIVEALKLTAKQKEAIRKIQDEAGAMFFGGPPSGPPGGPLGPGGPKRFEDPWKGTLEKILNILTDEQKVAWRQLTGEPFNGMVPMLGPGGQGVPLPPPPGPGFPPGRPGGGEPRPGEAFPRPGS